MKSFGEYSIIPRINVENLVRYSLASISLFVAIMKKRSDSKVDDLGKAIEKSIVESGNKNEIHFLKF